MRSEYIFPTALIALDVCGQGRYFPRTPRGRENNKPNNKEQQ